MNVKQIAEKLELSEQTILNYINSGKLKATKKRTGLRWRFEISESDLKEFKDKFLND